MQIDCVFFDYDGVLTTDATGSITTCRQNRALTLGGVTHEGVWSEICSDIGCALPLQLLTDAFDSTPAAACGMHAIHFDQVRNEVDGLAARLREEFSLPA